ncbi:MAG: hypothetical protein K0B14_16735 [Anaerolineaceae bacterium]|nr:hypothetical protein [Anaerolineaceae bacterium]
METTHYFSYLMRIWQGDDLPEKEWLASLEDPSTKQLTYFKSLEELFTFLSHKALSDKNRQLLQKNG